MNKKAINRAIAESLGWKHPEHSATIKAQQLLRRKGWIIDSNMWLDPRGRPEHAGDIPNFTDSLDACRLFEDRLNTDLYWDETNGAKIYVEWLVSVMSSGEYTALAKPEKRCEAYLRMKGLWKEEWRA